MVLSLCAVLPRFGGDDGERGIDRWTVPRLIDGFLNMRNVLDKRIRPHLQLTNDSWRVDETYVKVRGECPYLYRAVDSDGNTLDFMLSALAGW